MGYTAKWLQDEAKDRFNSFINKHPKGHAMQLWEWGDIKAKTGWKPRRMVVEADEVTGPQAGNKIIAAATILERKLPFIGAPIFYCPRGPVVDMEDQDKLAAVLQIIEEQARRSKAILLKIDPDIPNTNTSVRQLLQKFGFKSLDKGKNFEGVQPKFVFRLDISPDEETLLSNMHQKTRYNIRLAMRKGVTIRKGTKADLPEFYRVLKETTERDNFLVRAYSYFEDLYDSLVPSGYGEIFIGEYEGKIIAATFAFICGNKAWYVYGASSNSYRNVMPNYLIQWEMIRWAKDKGCKLYDFRGVSGDLDEANPLYGLYKFKKGFNGEFTEFIGEWDYIYRPWMYRLWKTAEKVYSGRLKEVLVRLLRRG